MKVLVATEKPFAPAAVTEIKQACTDAGYELVLLEKYCEASELYAAVADVDGLIIRSDKVTPEVIEAGKNLKIIVRAGAGYDNVNLEAATTKGVVVMNTPGQNSNAVAELAFGMMVFQARGHFNGKSGVELRKKTIGIHAYGNVGRYIGEIANGFGMDVYAYDPFVDAALIEKDGITPLHSAEELYEKCQYISLHIPANDKTKNSINQHLLELMPEGATLVNTARKEVICEDSLKNMFENRSDFRYLSDIAPLCADELAEKFAGRFFFTPKKMGAQTQEANVNAGVAAIRQIIKFLEKGDRTYQVN